MTSPINKGYHTQTYSGDFYVGMTAAQAKKQDVYKNLFSRDFTDVDTDKNNILSQKEILEERLHSAKSQWGLAAGVSGCFVGGLSVVANTIAKIPSGAISTGLSDGLASVNAFSSEYIQVGKKLVVDAENELKRFNNDKSAQKADEKYRKK